MKTATKSDYIELRLLKRNKTNMRMGWYDQIHRYNFCNILIQRKEVIGITQIESN